MGCGSSSPNNNQEVVEPKTNPPSFQDSTKNNATPDASQSNKGSTPPPPPPPPTPPSSSKGLTTPSPSTTNPPPPPPSSSSSPSSPSSPSSSSPLNSASTSTTKAKKGVQFQTPEDLLRQEILTFDSTTSSYTFPILHQKDLKTLYIHLLPHDKMTTFASKLYQISLSSDSNSLVDKVSFVECFVIVLPSLLYQQFANDMNIHQEVSLSIFLMLFF